MRSSPLFGTDMQTVKIIHLEEVDSTNAELRRRNTIEALPEWTVITTEFQQDGRGQKGASWESEYGANITMSYLLRPHFLPISQQFLLSEVGALGIVKALSEYTEGIHIKWPNDIYWEDYKLCGTLIETEWIEGKIDICISGNGINVNQTYFRSDAPNPISLRQIIGEEINREDLLQRILSHTKDYYERLRRGNQEEIMKEYFSLLYRADDFYIYADAQGAFEARIIEVTPEGQLILCDKDGHIRKYWFKEVRYLW